MSTSWALATMWTGFGPLCGRVLAHYVDGFWPTMWTGFGPLCGRVLAHYVDGFWPTMWTGFAGIYVRIVGSGHYAGFAGSCVFGSFPLI